MLLLVAGCGPSTGESNSEQGLESAVSGDVVSSWNQVAQTAIITIAGAPPAQDSYWSAIMHVAVYDAVNAGGDEGGRYKPLVASPTRRSPASREAAALAAAHYVLSTLMPSQKATFDTKLANDLAQIPDGRKKDNGIAMGVEAAQQVLAVHDGVIPAVTYTPPSGPGNWQPTPPAFATVTPGLPLVKPFTMSSPSQFRPGPPPALTSDVWARDYNETKKYGGGGDSPNLATDEQKNIGRLYGVEHPGAQYHRVVRRIAQENELTLSEAARFFAMVYVGFIDSSIACWEAKFHYNFWRPYTAIRNGATDGSDATAPDPNWTPLVPTPGHPEYPAAHGCFTGGFVEVLRAYFGTDKVHVIIDSAPTGLSHEFFDLDDLNAEIILARIYGGMHYRNSVEVGIGMGTGIAAQLSTHFFQRLPEREDRPRGCDRSYQTVDVPGAMLTFGAGINDHGQIVGRFFDADGVQRGFLREANGAFRVLNVPGSIITAASDINNLGEVVGRTTDPDGITRGFRYQGGEYTTFGFPGSDFTRARGVNDLGVVTGHFLSADGVEHGFILDARGFRQVDYPGSTTSDVWDADVVGRYVGDYSDTGDLVHGFILRRGAFQTVDFPGGAQSSVRGINLAGDIAGVFSDAADVLHAFIRVDDRYEQIDPPGSTPTPPSGALPFTAAAQAYRINNRGTVVGDFFDANSVAHAYVLTCAHED